MFKNKNRITKVSNAIFLTIIVLASVSLISLISNSGDIPRADLYSNMILMGLYILFSAIVLFITNKKIDLYKDEYSTSRHIFNLFTILSCMSIVLMICISILSNIFYEKVLLYPIIIEAVLFAIIYLIAYKEVSKDKLLNKNNEKKINISNILVVILLINYTSAIVATILQMLFNMVDIVPALKDICISLIWIAVVLIAYKLINEKHK